MPRFAEIIKTDESTLIPRVRKREIEWTNGGRQNILTRNAKEPAGKGDGNRRSLGRITMAARQTADI